MVTENFLSIIVPVFNTPTQHLSRCFDSLNNQTCKEFELIVVDDGSNAETAEFIDAWADMREHVRVVHAEHAGVAAARNRGLELVNTEYVAFSDSDDEYVCDFVKEAKEYVVRFRPDIIYGVIDLVPQNEFIQCDSKVHLYNTPAEIREIYKAFLHLPQSTIDFVIHNSQCSRLYLSEIARNVKFDERVVWAEDKLFNRGCLRQASSVCLVPDAWYKYYANEYSTTHMRKEMIFNLKKTYYDACRELNQHETEEMICLLYVSRIEELNDIIACDILSKEGLTSDNAALKISGKNILIDALNHPFFKEAFEELKGNRDIGFANRVYVFLVNHRMYGLLLLICRIVRGLRHAKRRFRTLNTI